MNQQCFCQESFMILNFPRRFSIVRRGSLALTLFSIIAIASSAAAQKATVQPSDIANLKRVEAPRVSPDGALVAYTVDIPVAAGKHRDAHIWLVSTDHPDCAALCVQRSGRKSPDWSPDGTHLAFLSDRPNPLAESDSSPFHFSVAPGSNRPDLTPPAKDETVQDSATKAACSCGGSL